MKNIAESERVGKIVKAKKKRCYLNAFRVIQNVPDYGNADYVEGIAVLGNFPVEHGWIEKDGEVIDPTLPNHKITYFPGLRFEGQRGIAKALEIHSLNGTDGPPFFHAFGWGGIDSPEFRAASVAAYRHAGMETLAKQYEDYQPLCEEEDDFRALATACMGLA